MTLITGTTPSFFHTGWRQMVEGTHEQLLVIDHDGFLTVRISHPMVGVWLQINKPVTFVG